MAGVIRLSEIVGGAMSDQERVNVMQVETEEDFSNNAGAPDPAPVRKRKTKEEQIGDIDLDILKFKQKISQLEERKKRLSLTPAEKKAAKRKAEDHCKIIAGVIAFELCKKGKVFLTPENFKKRLFDQLTDPLEITFLNKQFAEYKN